MSTFVSATIITHNEARNIERCLNSLIGVADEIIVVDSLSTDATVDICRRYGCQVTSRAFAGYGSQRQYATGLANGRYVLSIDADEVLSPKLRANIIKLKNQGFTHRMYRFRVVNFICGQPMRRSGMQPDLQIRLFDRRYAAWDLLDVGERLTYPEGVQPCTVEGDICHFRCSDFDELDFKELRNAEMRGRVLAAAGIDAPMPMSWLRAASAYVKCQLREGAILDGEAGMRIARARYMATLAAYRAARRIRRKGGDR
ncbi:MAG: glycosyltransferase family 2 protein [Muribaculaceae bacterium]|nr:glycosyltransferase family 2 protein [Muribaculaceae bacterium]